MLSAPFETVAHYAHLLLLNDFPMHAPSCLYNIVSKIIVCKVINKLLAHLLFLHCSLTLCLCSICHKTQVMCI